MSKQFKKISMVSSNEVSLCSKYNSGANKQTEFEIIKNKEEVKQKDVKPVLEKMVKFIDLMDEKEDTQSNEVTSFKDFLNYWVEYDINNALYNLLSEGIQNAIYDLKYNEKLTKEEKAVKFTELFNAFIEEYKKMPITKTQEGKYEVSLVSKSLIQDKDTNPQSETQNTTKEKTSEMKTEEQKTVIQKAIELLTSAFSLEKTETPAESTEEVKPEGEEVQTPEVNEEVAKEADKPVEEKPAEVEAPIVENAEETVVQEDTKPEGEEKVEKSSTSTSELETVLKQKLDLEKELDEIKKAQAEKEEEITKMSFVQKAKDEYSMLVGTPEAIGEKLYTISKSNLDEVSKTFIMEQLKKVAKTNEELTEEKGSMTKSADDMSDEDKVYAKAEEIAKAKNISINKALRQVK